jgi:hypothetical protein
MAKVIAHPPNLQRGQPTTLLPNMKYPHMGPQMIDQVLDQGSLGTESYHPIPCRSRPTLPSFVPILQVVLKMLVPKTIGFLVNRDDIRVPIETTRNQWSLGPPFWEPPNLGWYQGPYFDKRGCIVNWTGTWNPMV